MSAAPSGTVPDAASLQPTLRLTDLPDDILLRIFRALPAACGFRAHRAWRASDALGATCVRLRGLLREALVAAVIPVEDSHFSGGDVARVVQLCGGSLRSLRISRPCAPLRAALALLLAAPPPRLRALTLADASPRSNVDPAQLARVVSAAGPSLRVLRIGLRFPARHLHTVLAAVAGHCTRLEALALDNLCLPPGAPPPTRALAAAWRAVGGTLSELSILRAQGALRGGAFVDGVAGGCPALRALAVDGDAFASPGALAARVGAALGPRLRSLAVRDAALGDADADALLSRCERLTGVGFVGTAVTARSFRRLIALRGECVEIIEMTDVVDLVDGDVAELAEGAPLLRELRLRKCRKLTDGAFPHGLCKRLEALDVRDCPKVGDATLDTLAAVRAPLREMFLNETRITEAGVANLLRRCGPTLVTLHMRFKGDSRVTMREPVRKLLAMYCRSGTLQSAVLE